MELRPYQEDAILALMNFYFKSDEKNGLCVLPTASGKTIIFATLIKRLIADRPKLNVLILAHTQEIVHQNEEKLRALWPDVNVGVFCSGLRRKEVKQITSA